MFLFKGSYPFLKTFSIGCGTLRIRKKTVFKETCFLKDVFGAILRLQGSYPFF